MPTLYWRPGHCFQCQKNIPETGDKNFCSSFCHRRWVRLLLNQVRSGEGAKNGILKINFVNKIEAEDCAFSFDDLDAAYDKLDVCGGWIVAFASSEEGCYVAENSATAIALLLAQDQKLGITRADPEGFWNQVLDERHEKNENINNDEDWVITHSDFPTR